MPTDPRYRVPMLGHALDVVEALARRGPLRLAPLCEVTRVNKTSAFRILATLVERGFAERAPDGSYRLGPALVPIGRRAEAQAPLVTRALPLLDELHARFGETVNLVRRDGARIVYAAVRESGHRFRISASVGDPAVPHATACGKAILAHQPPEVLQRILAESGAGGSSLPRFTARSLATRAQLARALASVRAEGLAYDEEEAELGVSCIGVPILDARGVAEYALSVSGPTSRVRPRRAAIAQALRRAGRTLSQAQEVAA